MNLNTTTLLQIDVIRDCDIHVREAGGDLQLAAAYRVAWGRVVAGVKLIVSRVPVASA